MLEYSRQKGAGLRIAEERRRDVALNLDAAAWLQSEEAPAASRQEARDGTPELTLSLYESLEACAAPDKGAVELLFTYDEEFGGELGPGWLLQQGLTRPDYLLAAGFSYQVVTAHNGCLQMEVTVHGKMAHAAIPDTGVDALRGTLPILQALYAENLKYRALRSDVAGITHPYLNVGRIEGGTNTNVVPGKVVLKLDRRMIPEENPAEVEASVRQVIERAAAGQDGIRVEVRRLLLAESWKPQTANAPLVAALHVLAREQAVPDDVRYASVIQ